MQNVALGADELSMGGGQTVHGPTTLTHREGCSLCSGLQVSVDLRELSTWAVSMCITLLISGSSGGFIFNKERTRNSLQTFKRQMNVVRI